MAVAWKRKAESHERLGQKELAISALEMWCKLDATKDVRQEVERRVKRLKQRRWF